MKDDEEDYFLRPKIEPIEEEDEEEEAADDADEEEDDEKAFITDCASRDFASCCSLLMCSSAFCRVSSNPLTLLFCSSTVERAVMAAKT
jgi:hypothetical protein